MGGDAALKDKTVALVYHDSPYGKEPIPALEVLSKKLGFELALYPVTHRASNRGRSGFRFAKPGPSTCCCGGGA
jgi:hypothetical protein